MWKTFTIAIAAGGAILAGCGGAPTVSQGPAAAPQAVAHAAVASTPEQSPWEPALPQPAPAAVGGADGVGYMCWDAFGNPLPQDSATCAPGWGGRTPEHPLSIDDLGSGGIVP